MHRIYTYKGTVAGLRKELAPKPQIASLSSFVALFALMLAFAYSFVA